METKTKLPILDSMEMLNVSDSLHEFPLHFHDTYCISIIDKGFFGENGLIAPPKSILISHPYEVHENKLVNDSSYKITTFYVNEDILKFVCNTKNIYFENKVINSPHLFHRFKNLSVEINETILNLNNQSKFELDTLCLFNELTKLYSKDEPHTIQSHVSKSLEEVKHYICTNLEKRIELDYLALMMNMDKYKFIRSFKKNVGLTPFGYIIMNRIELAKGMIKIGRPLSQVAVDSGFYDQSHFSNYFKRFVGQTPREYFNSCNMFQDNRIYCA